MTEKNGLNSLSILRRNLSQEKDPHGQARSLAKYIAQVFSADRVELEIETGLQKISTIEQEGAEDSSLWMEIDPSLEGPIFVADINKVRLESSLKRLLTQSKVKSFAKVPIYAGGLIIGSIAVYSLSQYKRWQPVEALLLETLADLSSALIYSNSLLEEKLEKNTGKAKDQFREVDIRSERLLEHGNLVIVRTDENRVITDVHGDTEAVLGYPHEELLGLGNVWNRIIHPEDFSKLEKKFARMGKTPSEISEEIRLLPKTGEVQKWIILRAVPTYQDDVFLGWEGFGVDISEKTIK